MPFLPTWLLFSLHRSSICFLPPPNIFIAGQLTALWVYINLPGTPSISPLCPLPLLPHSIDFSEHFLHVYTNYLCWNSVSIFIIFFLFFLWPLLLIPYILLLSSTINLCYSKLIMICLPPAILFDHLHTALYMGEKKIQPPRSCLPASGSLIVGLVWKVPINFLRVSSS